ncbi:MAG TPA: TylF/MycF/NovP-related O-methyltransferase [Kiritimatiellia bacterium]|nr:TylF/MycF/NovP-related O-methyltransferase [Kiritimatiellia bacterium]HRZ13279.1 TylF/MycF/NovP-related O-methyltransferase [Kiritimatiellia bacterium]HSA18728.1 TylF/MycF/NovP-related O-methyltransferase [Kiritimatiellia bacterium]
MLVTGFRVKLYLYRAVQAFYRLIEVGQIHPVRELKLRALQRTTDYIEKHALDAVGLDTQRDLIDYSLREVRVPGFYLEFGVFTGGTIRHIAKQLPAGQLIHGFDSFEGLPEAWSGFDLGKDTFNLKGKLPKVPPNVVLHKGWFKDTIPAWLKENSGKIAFLHIDCDLFSSTVEILDGLAPRMQAGTVVLFDDYFNYPNWENHGFKAWQDYVAKHGVKYDYIGYARQQAAVRVLDPGAIAK